MVSDFLRTYIESAPLLGHHLPAGIIWRDSDGREWVPRDDLLRLEAQVEKLSEMAATAVEQADGLAAELRREQHEHRHTRALADAYKTASGGPR